MATHNITISSVNPVQLLSSANLNVSTVANLDAANSVWLSSDPGGGAGAIELTAGSTLSWDSMRSLYAYVVAGTTVKVLVLDNGGTFNNGVAVANALTASGLAASIANQIYIAGVPAVDNPALLSFSINANIDGYTTGSLNIARHQSITVIVSGAGTIGRDVNVFMDGAISTDPNYTFVAQFGGVTTFVFPANGSSLTVSVNGIGSAFVGTVSVTGSYRTVSRAYWKYSNSASGTRENQAIAALGGALVTDVPGFFSWAGTNPANTATINYPPKFARNGRVHFTCQHNGGAGTFAVGINDGLSTAWLMPSKTFAVAADYAYDFNVGYRPFSIQFACNGLIGTAYFTLTTEV